MGPEGWKKRGLCRDWPLRLEERPQGSSGAAFLPVAKGQDAGSPTLGWTSRPRHPRPWVPWPENSARDAAVGARRRPRAVTGPPAAPTLTLRRLGSRARPPQPPGGLPRPQRRKQPPALLAALLSCSHLCARAPPPPPPEGRLLPPPPPRVCQVPGSRRGRRGRRGRSLRPGRGEGEESRGGKRGGGDSCSGSARLGAAGPRRGCQCDELARETLSARQLYR